MFVNTCEQNKKNFYLVTEYYKNIIKQTLFLKKSADRRSVCAHSRRPERRQSECNEKRRIFRRKAHRTDTEKRRGVSLRACTRRVLL